MDDGSTAIARISSLNVGHPSKTSASEVVTMDFVSDFTLEPEVQKLTSGPLQARTVLKIPVPKVLSWSGKADNIVESEYKLIKEAAGSQRGKSQDNMDLHDKLKIVEDIVATEKKLLSIFFTQFVNPKMFQSMII
jgi:hypothetical protein